MRGRKPKPTAVKVAQGNPGRRQLPKNEPKPSGKLGDPPCHLSAVEQKIWRDAAASAHWLTDADWVPMEVFCQLMAESRAGFADMSTPRITCLLKTAAMLGLSPADRARIGSAPKPSAADPSEAFFPGPPKLAIV